jgi:uncharacterized protein YyaL (SSP411 family)
VFNLLVLSHLVERGDPQWASRIERTFRYFGERLEQMGRGVPMMAAALSMWTAGVQQVVLAGEQPGDDEALGRVMASRYLPFAIELSLTPARAQELAARMPLVAAMRPVGHAAAAYVCRDFTCQQPVTDAEALKELVVGR